MYRRLHYTYYDPTLFFVNDPSEQFTAFLWILKYFSPDFGFPLMCLVHKIMIFEIRCLEVFWLLGTIYSMPQGIMVSFE